MGRKRKDGKIRSVMEFRAWDIREEAWINPEKFLIRGDGKVLFLDKADYKDAVVTQFTGAVDKEENKIYEGDIVKCKVYDFSRNRSSLYTYITRLVVFESCKTGITTECKFKLKRFYYNETTRRSGYPTFKQKWIEVIGNIFENTNMLEEKDKTYLKYVEKIKETYRLNERIRNEQE